MKKYLIILSWITLLISCQNESESPAPQISRPAILNEMLDLAEANSINRMSIDWTMARDSVGNVFDQSGLEQSIRTLLRILGDNHSSYRTTNTIYFESTLICQSNNFTINNLPEQVGYVAVGGFSGTNEAGLAFAESIQQTIREGQARGVTSWIVDLTGNTGGNMFPMVAGLGPLLGNDILGYFLFPNGTESIWGYQNGVAYENSVALGPRTTITDPLDIISEDIKVAVVIDNLTISSGEATAISFIGRPNTRFFGAATCGLSTVNFTYTLSNGALFVLTQGTMADRERNAFGGSIVPDETFDHSEDLNTRVFEWLAEE